MARISSYAQDTSLNTSDKVLGTDSASDGTKNFSISSIIQLINDLGAIYQPDGIPYTFSNLVSTDTDPQGVLSLTGGSPYATAFSSVTQIILSKKGVDGIDVSGYLLSLVNDVIKIVDRTNKNVFGIFTVTAVADYTNDKYYILTVSHKESVGSFQPSGNYFAAMYSAAADLASRYVTELLDITSAGSGAIITAAERTAIGNSLVASDIVDNLLSTDNAAPLSASQGKVLKDAVDAINVLLTSDITSLDTIQEIVDYIEVHESTLSALNIASIAGLTAALAAKQPTEVGKGLSANDYTDALNTKLTGIADNAEVNVQADWTATSGDALILNKPSDITDLSTHSVTETNDITSVGSGSIILASERTKLTGIETGAEVNVQSNWTETNTAADSFIQGKPSVAESTTTLDVSGTTNEIEVTGGIQSLAANRSWVVGLPNDVTVSSDLIVGDTIAVSNMQTSTPAFDNGLYFKAEDGHDTLHFRYDGHDLSIDVLTENVPTGILKGGVLATNTATTFDIAAGDGLINLLNKSNGNPHPEIKNVSWAAQTITHTLGSAGNTEQLNTWVYINNAGTVTQTLTQPSAAIWRNNIVLGSVIHSENVIRFVKTFPRAAYGGHNNTNEFIETFGPLKKSGHLVTPNGANLKLDRAAGSAFALGRNYATDPVNPSLVTDSSRTSVIFNRYSSTSSGFTLDDGINGGGYTDIDPTLYDNDGTLTSVPSGKYTVQRMFYFPNNINTVVVYYGKENYVSIDEAELGYLLEHFQEATNTASQAIYLGAVIVKANASALNDTAQAKILISGTFRSLAATNLGGTVTANVISDLVDVAVTAPAEGHILKWNATASQFENGAESVGDLAADTANNRIGINRPVPDATFDIKGTAVSSTANILSVKNNSSAEIFTVRNNGNVGVGTSAPTDAKVHLSNTATGVDTALRLSSNADATNTIQFGDTADQTAGSVLYNNADNSMQFSTNDNTERMRIIADGKVGVNIAVPTHQLHVDGDAKITGAIAASSTIAATGAVTGSNLAINNWNTAFGWGNHANGGYLTEHPAITQATADLNNSGRTYIQDITLDSNGHVTGVATATETVTDTDTTYTGTAPVAISAGNAISVDFSPITLDTTNSRIGINDTSPAVSLDITGTDAIRIPSGTTAQKPGVPAVGMLRYNTTDSEFEGHNGTAWYALKGDTYAPLTIAKNGSNQFPLVFAASENFQLNAAGTWTILPTVAASDIGKTGTIIITNTATTTPGTLPTVFKTPNGDTIAFQTDNGDVSILSYIVVSQTIVLVNYVGNFS